LINNLFFLVFNLAVFAVIYWAWKEDGKSSKADDLSQNNKRRVDE